MAEVNGFQRDFEGIPPFPDDVLTVPLLRLSLQKLIDGDAAEADRLWQACTTLGFFYLDLRHASASVNGHVNGHASSPTLDGDRLVADADRLFDISAGLFALPDEEKVKYDLKDRGSYFGFKPMGAGFLDAKGTRDRNEFYNASKDDVLGLSDPLPAPAMLKEHHPLLSSYMINAHSIVALLLERLTTLLGLHDGSLTSLHRLRATSGDQVRFVRSPPQPMDDRTTALGAHTDYGSITLLFNKLGGLQVFPGPGIKDSTGRVENEWMYVRPLPGHCIVNLGDALVKFTSGLLRSNTHRVVNPPGEEQGSLVRTSLVYFARPEDEVQLRSLQHRGSSKIDAAAAARAAAGEEDEDVSAKDWILRRALGRRGVGEFKDAAGTEAKGSG